MNETIRHRLLFVDVRPSALCVLSKERHRVVLLLGPIVLVSDTFDQLAPRAHPRVLGDEISVLGVSCVMLPSGRHVYRTDVP